MFEVDVKNVTEEGRRGGGGDQLGFGVLIQYSTVQYNTVPGLDVLTVIDCPGEVLLYGGEGVASPDVGDWVAALCSEFYVLCFMFYWNSAISDK